MFSAEQLHWPQDRDLNAWADYAELLCVLHADRQLTVDHLADHIADAEKKDGDKLSAVNFTETYVQLLCPPPNLDPVVVIEDEHEDEQAADEDSAEAAPDFRQEVREKIWGRMLRLFSFLEARARYFGPFYPFSYSPQQGLTLKADALTRIQRLYLAMLCSSQMQVLSPADINLTGHRFEAACRIPFELLLPQLAQRFFFGAGGGTVLPADYGGSLDEKLRALATDLGVRTKPAVDDPDEIGRSGDAGLDWVGWVPFMDSCRHQPVFFAQCACGTDWIEKQHETSLARWANFLDLDQSVQCIHFMPRSHRRDTLAWMRETDIHRELTLIDRYRMLHLLNGLEDVRLDEVLQPYLPMLEDAFTLAMTG